MIARLLVMIWLPLVLAAPAWAGDEALCQRAVASAARRHAVDRAALSAIALVESGRLLGATVAPWPWTIDRNGAGQYFATKAEAVDAVRQLWASGERSVDVGCMQVNLAYHPDAFVSLEDAFDPDRNADYAARFLLSLQARTGTLATALTAYHSESADKAADYARRLLAVWPDAARLGLGAPPPPLPPPSNLTDRFARRLTQDHRALARLGPGLETAALRSEHGAAWPDSAQPH